MTGFAATGRRSGTLGRLLLPLLLVLCGCQPLPHPFAEDKPPAALLEVKDAAGVSIAPLVGGPPAVVGKLGAAVAKALLKHDIPASDKTASLDSYRLYGRIIASPLDGGQTTLSVQWWLYDAKGRLVGKRSVKVAAAAGDWQTANAAPIEKLAGLSGEQLAPLLEDKMPVAAAVTSEDRVRVAIDPITGAPGDGATALASAITAVLRQQNVDVVAADGKADLHIQCEVTVAPAGSGQQHVKIGWHVRRSDGIEVGTVGQENDVPSRALDGAWGELAYNVAIAANPGLMQLVVRAAAAPSQSAAQAANRRPQ